ncbi:Vacuolar protein sorting-associated protein 20 [Cladochytrium tenue]|nr:Vacuolar protein sorting-associated protein 20 [Cladochytrium tenue]
MQLLNLEHMTQTIEYSLIEMDIVAGLKKGNEVLAQIHKEMSVEAVEKLMDDTADAIAYQNEIDEAISGRITADDMEDIVAELDAILHEQLGEAPRVPDSLPAESVELPNVPDRPLPAHEAVQSSKSKNRQRLEEPMPA